jgi:hypothetical protein
MENAPYLTAGHSPDLERRLPAPTADKPAGPDGARRTKSAVSAATSHEAKIGFPRRDASSGAD